MIDPPRVRVFPSVPSVVKANCRFYPPVPVTAETRHHLLLTVKEALNNAVRHVAAETIRLKLHVHNGRLEVVISDDGHGFELRQASAAGHGLGNLAKRMKQIQGRAEIRSAPGQGTVVTLSVPLPGKARGTLTMPFGI